MTAAINVLRDTGAVHVELEQTKGRPREWVVLDA
jgi:hypothetical protein